MSKAYSEVLFSWEGPILIADYQMKFIDREKAELMVQQRIEFTKGEPCLVMVKNQTLMILNKGARDYLSSELGTHGIMAAAIITDTGFKKSLTNFFLSVTRPNIPTRMFKDEQKAKEWLLTFQT